MAKFMPMVDMRRTDKGMEVSSFVGSPAPSYPYGLCISLCEEELEKLNLDIEDAAPGDMLHLFCMAKVTSVSKNDTENGNTCRVELQITHIAAESEDEENERSAEEKIGKLYNKD